MREDRTGDLEALCANLIDLEKSAAEETFRLATGLANEEDEELGVWANIIQLLAQRQLVMRSRLATAALQRDIEGIREVAAEVAQVAAESRDNAGMVGELELATYFDQLAKDERSTANKFRYAAIGILVLSAGLVYGVSFEKAISTGEIIRHVAFVLPALGLSTYLGAEAAKHRRSAQWAEAVKVQLRTVGLFCASMDRESATSIRKHLANRVFGALPGEGSEPPTDVALSPAVLEQLAVLVRTSKG
jgi:hypothetical protein